MCTDDEDEDEDEDDDDEDSSRDTSNQRLKNTFRDTMNRLVESGGGGNRVMIIGSNGGLSSLMRGGENGISRVKKGEGRKPVITLNDEDDDEDEDEDDDDDDDDDDEKNESDVKELLVRTLLAVRWLHSVGRLSDVEKRDITGDIIRHMGDGEFSRAEVAFTLLIGTGQHGTSGPVSSGRLGEKVKDSSVSVSRNMLLGLLDSSSSSGSGGSSSRGVVDESFDMSLVAQDDMSEFEDVCRVIARGVSEERRSRGNDMEESNDGDDSDDNDPEYEYDSFLQGFRRRG